MIRPRTAGLALVLAATLVAPTAGAAPEDLLSRVPGDAVLAVSVENLRDHAREILDSPLAARLFDLPMVKEWMKRGGDGAIRKAAKQLEEALGMPLAMVRDELLGDAVVLSLHAEPGSGEPRGLVLIRPRDRTLLERLVRASNEDPARHWRVVPAKTKGGHPYFIRSSGEEEPEAYTFFDDGSFAWSNSTSLIERAAGEGPAEAAPLPKAAHYLALASSLPEHALLRAYFNPAQFLASFPLPEEPEAKAFAEFLASLRGAAFALDWREGPSAKLALAVAPESWDARWRDWLPKPDKGPDFRKSIPPEPFAVLAVRADLATIGRWLLGQIPSEDRARAEALVETVRGLLLGNDPVRDILPALGPDLLAYLLGPRAEGSDPALVMMVALSDAEHVAPALNNALRTLFALIALNGTPAPKLEARRVEQVDLTTLSGKGTHLAYGIRAGRLVVGTSPEAVVEALRDPEEHTGTTRFERARATYFPEGETFLYFDLEALTEFATSRRGDWARWLGGTDHPPADAELDDFAHAVELLGLFRFAYLSIGVSEEQRTASVSFGLVARDLIR